MAAISIWLMTAASVWGNARHLAFVAVVAVVSIAINVRLNHIQVGRRLELFVRTTTTSVHMVATAVVVGWTAPCWMWPVFVALAFDPSADRYAFGVVLTVVVTQDVAAVVDGQSWIAALSWSALAIYASLISAWRVQIISTMLARSDRQRAEIEVAHDQVTAALDELRRETAVRQRIEIELRAAQQLEAIGRIAAGVAHEINTPVQFVGDNLRFLQDGVGELLAIRQLDAAARTADPGERARLLATATAAEAEADIAYLTERLPQATGDALQGIERVATIVQSMRQLSRLGDGTNAAADLNRAIHATLTVSRSEYKLVADVEYAPGDIPGVTCNPGEINQVLLNIIVNAAHAIAEVVGDSGARGVIRIATARDGDDVVISISDTGGGIPEHVRDRVFDPFFTTKEVGRGTGQGLAIARAIIDRHHGQLSFDTVPGQGTTFHIRLPIRPAALPASLADGALGPTGGRTAQPRAAAE